MRVSQAETVDVQRFKGEEKDRVVGSSSITEFSVPGFVTFPCLHRASANQREAWMPLTALIYLGIWNPLENLMETQEFYPRVMHTDT